jgi:hypothetical protein
VAALALGVLLLTDLLRVWRPSIITILGQAASTPAELMGAFALLWFVVAFAAPPLVRAVGVRPVALASAVVLAACRVALLATGGGQSQLYVASVGLLAGLVWLAATAAATADPLPGGVSGLALGTLAHAAVDTHDLTWRGSAAAWAVVALAAALFLLAQWASPAADPSPAGGAAAWFLFGPVLLLWGMLAGSPALAGVAISYAYGDEPGVANAGSFGDLPVAVLVATASGLSVAAAFLGGPRRVVVPVGAVAVLAATIGFARTDGSLLWPAIPLAALGSGLLWNASQRRAPDRRRRVTRSSAAWWCSRSRRCSTTPPTTSATPTPGCRPWWPC